MSIWSAIAVIFGVGTVVWIIGVLLLTGSILPPRRSAAMSEFERRERRRDEAVRADIRRRRANRQRAA